MQKVLSLFGMTAGGWVGWAVGAPFSLFAAFMWGIVGTGAGLYLGRRIGQDYF
ncbi:MAG TPA: hypothetical protein VE913_24325 [Longimicrobium sp.]|nr:hypothetical protein [Longimicrobium sp.]